MAFNHGSKAKVYVNGYDMSGYLNSVDVDMSADEADASTFGDSFKQNVLGLIDAHLNASGLFDGSAGASDEVLEAALGNTTNSLWCYMPAGDSHGGVGYGMKASETSYKVSTPVTGVAAVTAAAHSQVGQERLAILHALAAETTTGDGTSVDNGASTTNGGSAYLMVTALTGSNATVKIQDSADDVTYADLVSFTQVTGANAKERVTFTGTVNEYTKTVLSGTFTSVTFFCGIHRS